MKGLGISAVINEFLRKRFRHGGQFGEGFARRSRWFYGAECGSCIASGNGVFTSPTRGSELNSGHDYPDSEDGRVREQESSDSRRSWSDSLLTSLVRFRAPYYLVQHRNYGILPLTDGGRWTRIPGTYGGPLHASPARDPFRDGCVRFKSRKKQKKAKQKKREVLSKIKRIRVATKKRKEDMTPEEMLEFRIQKGKRKIELIDQQIAKFPVQELPPVDPDVEVLTPEQLHYLKKIGYKNKNYVPVGRRGVYGGTIQNIHLHWKKHETVQVEIAGFSKEEIKVMADQLARLSGGLVVDIHQNNIVILYRGRNYKQPKELIPIKTLDKRKALMKSKLEQSKKALILNQEKLEKELKQLRRDIALGFAVGAQPADPARDDDPIHRNLGPGDKEQLQDPDSYGTRLEDDVEEVYEYLSDVEGVSDMSDLTSDDEENEEDDFEEEDSDPEDLGMPQKENSAATVKYRR